MLTFRDSIVGERLLRSQPEASQARTGYQKASNNHYRPDEKWSRSYESKRSDYEEPKETHSYLESLEARIHALKASNYEILYSLSDIK